MAFKNEIDWRWTTNDESCRAGCPNPDHQVAVPTQQPGILPSEEGDEVGDFQPMFVRILSKGMALFGGTARNKAGRHNGGATKHRKIPIAHL